MSTPAESVTTEQANLPNRLLHGLSHVVQRSWRTLILAVPYAWLLIFFLAPFFFVLKISLAEYALKNPPYTDLIEWVDEGVMHIRVVVDNYA